MNRLLPLLLAFAAPAAAEATLPGLFTVAVPAGDALNVRGAPGAGAEIIGRLPPGTRGLEVVAIDASGAWGQVNAGERAGWVALRYLEPEPDVWEQDLPASLACFGTEPFWSVRPAGGAAVLSEPGRPDLRLPLTALRDTSTAGIPRRALVAASAAERLTAFVAPGICSDGMSDRLYGLTAAVVHEQGGEARLLTGCCSIAPEPEPE
jgi:uncharacterized membrane protein